MKRVFAFLLAMIVAILPAASVLSEEVDVFISTGELILDKDNSNTGNSELDEVNNSNASILQQLGKKDWVALAEAA